MKKTLAILLALVLCLSAFALIACNKCDHVYGDDGVCVKCGDKNPDYKPDDNNGGDNDAEVPVTEGKVTLYFTLADDSVAIPDYASVYFAGTLTNWNDDAEHPAPAMTHLEGTNIYYVQLVYDATLDNATQYTLVLGYNENSGLPADKLGLKWNDNYKSDYCQTFAFGTNAEFTYTEGATKISLGTHKWSTGIATPERIAKTTLRITFATALPETATVYIMGSATDWNATKSKATANTDRTVYSVEITDVLCTEYEYKVLVFNNESTAVKTKHNTETNKDEDLDIWSWEDPTDATLRAYIEIGPEEGNLPLSVVKTDNNSYIDLAGTVSENQLDKQGNVEVPKTGLDLTKATKVANTKTEKDPTTGEDKKVPDGTYTMKYYVTANKTLTAKFATALPETAMVYIDGTIFNWNASPDEMKMTIAEDRMSATKTISMLPGEIEFRVIVIHKDIELESRQTIWDFGAPTQTSNTKLTVEGFEDGVVNLFTAAQTVPEIKEPETVENVVLKVKFDKALTGKHVFIAGNFEGWSGKEMTVSPDDATVYTYTVDKIIVKGYEFLITLSDTNEMSWSSKYAKDGVLGANDNATMTITKTTTTVDLFGETVLVAPKSDDEKEYAESVTLTVTFSESITGHVFFVGVMNNWSFQEMTAGEDNTYTITFTNVEVKSYDYKVVISPNATTSWNDDARSELGANAPAYGGGNASVTIASTSTTSVTLFDGVTLVAPATAD